MIKLVGKHRSGLTPIKTLINAEGVNPRRYPRISASTILQRSYQRISAFKNGFTLIELLIVITIIAILAATIMPNFIGFDVEARISATKTNLDSLRTRITLFRAKEGRYPESLGELLNTYYIDAGIRKPYLNRLPPEMISEKAGNSDYVDILSSEEPLVREGGWVYYKDLAELHINLDEPLGSRWGEFAEERPIDW